MITFLFNKFISLRFLPHILVYYTTKPDMRNLLDYERDKWLEKHHSNLKGLRGLICLLKGSPEYRSLFYHRTQKKWLKIFSKAQTTLFLDTPSHLIGKGLVIWHGYSTIINARSIGEDCEIWHNVTIGKKNTSQEENRPAIGNHVKICTGAVAIGHITVHDHTTVGANALVLKDTPPSSLAVGVPARMIQKQHFD